MQFFGKFSNQIIGERPHLEVGAPSSGKSWISHCIIIIPRDTQSLDGGGGVPHLWTGAYPIFGRGIPHLWTGGIPHLWTGYPRPDLAEVPLIHARREILYQTTWTSCGIFFTFDWFLFYSSFVYDPTTLSCLLTSHTKYDRLIGEGCSEGDTKWFECYRRDSITGKKFCSLIEFSLK